MDIVGSTSAGSVFVKILSDPREDMIARYRYIEHEVRLKQVGRDDKYGIFEIPVKALLLRELAQVTLDIHTKVDGRLTRVVWQDQTPDATTHHGIDLLNLRTGQGNHSISLFRRDVREKLKVSVVLLQYNFSGGKTTAMFTLASALKEAGFDVTLVALLLTNSSMAYQPPEDVKLDYIDSTMLQMPDEAPFKLAMPEFSASPESLARVQAYFASSDADVVYFPDYDSPFYDLILKCLKPTTLSILGDHNPGRYGKSLRDGKVPNSSPRDALFHKAMQRFNAIHAINPAVLTAYERSTKKPVYCIPNAINVPGSYMHRDRTKRRIISAGRLVKEKGFQNLIAAFADIHKLFPKWRLDIFGQGDMRDELLELIHTHRAKSFIEIHRPTPNLLDEMRNSSLLVSASTIESFGLTMAEAMSVGLPVFSQHMNAGAAYLLNKQRGIVNNGGDFAAGLRNCLTLIEDDSSDLYQMTERAFSFTSEISHDTVVGQWKKVINAAFDNKMLEFYGSKRN